MRTVKFVMRVREADEKTYFAIAKWYTHQATFWQGTVANYRTAFLSNTRIEVTYDTSNDESIDAMFNQMLADPDDEYMYPITIRGNETFLLGYIE